MNFIQGQTFNYAGRKFKVLSKWNSAQPTDEWDVDFIEDGREEVVEVITRKLGHLKQLYKERKIN